MSASPPARAPTGTPTLSPRPRTAPTASAWSSPATAPPYECAPATPSGPPRRRTLARRHHWQHDVPLRHARRHCQGTSGTLTHRRTLTSHLAGRPYTPRLQTRLQGTARRPLPSSEEAPDLHFW